MSPYYSIGRSVERAGMVRRYQRKFGDPVWRPLQIYSTDPSESQLNGSRVVINVPYEELEPGPIGSLFEVVGFDTERLAAQVPVDLNDPRLLCTQGLTPSPDAHFQMQMTYAVAMTTYQAFRQALGRDLHWGFDSARLKLYPFGSEMNNANYDRNAGAIRFGWFHSEDHPQQGDATQGGRINARNLRKGKVYTSLSHDIIVHEVSHALLDGLRPHFLKPYHRDTLALHEGFSDLIAIFQHFSHRDLLEVAIARSRGKLSESHLLTDIARQFGQTQSQRTSSLRSAVDDYECTRDGVCGVRRDYSLKLKIHELGSVLVSSIFEAFTQVFDRKSKRYVKIATGGTGVLPEGELSGPLVEVLAKEASELASQFLSICIRALDYCPPMAVTFGDYLRAMITADRDLVPSDPYGYREALVDAFVRRRIPIAGVDTLSESALVWPLQHIRVDPELLAIVQFASDDMLAMSINSAQRYRERATRIADYLVRDGAIAQLGLHMMGQQSDLFTDVSKPCIDSARISRRVSPDGQLETDLIIEVTQTLQVMLDGRPFPVMHGSTIIVDGYGNIRFIIKKDATEYATGLLDGYSSGQFDLAEYWQAGAGMWEACPNLLPRMHGC